MFLYSHKIIKTKIIKLNVNYRLIPGTLIALSMSYSTVVAKSLGVEKFMAETITDAQTLESRPEDMKTIMELMIMNIQVNLPTYNLI